MLRTINEDGSLQPLSEPDAQTLIEHRKDTGFADMADFLSQAVFSGKKLDAVSRNLGESSDYFLLSAEAEVADRRVRLYSVLERRGREVITLARASGSL